MYIFLIAYKKWSLHTETGGLGRRPYFFCICLEIRPAAYPADLWRQAVGFSIYVPLTVARYGTTLQCR